MRKCERAEEYSRASVRRASCGATEAAGRCRGLSLLLTQSPSWRRRGGGGGGGGCLRLLACGLQGRPGSPGCRGSTACRAPTAAVRMHSR